MAKIRELKDYSIANEIEVKRKNVKVKDILEGFEWFNDQEKKLVAYKGKLDIRPAFQREFIYELEDEQSVIRSILNDFPLSLMYWGDNEDGTFEIIDGQQRTLSVLRFIKDIFQAKVNTVSGEVVRNFSNLDTKIQEKILNYEFDVAILKGGNELKLAYFKIINTSGKILNEQELLNASYSGKFVTGARKLFSNKNSIFLNERGADGNWTNFLHTNEDIERQELLNKVLKWVSKNKGQSVEEYLATNINSNPQILEKEILKIVKWAKNTFAPETKDFNDELLGVNWGEAYYLNKSLEKNERIENKLTPKDLVKMIKETVDQPAVTKPKGVIMYLVTNDDKYLNTRNFSAKDRRAKWLEQNKCCNICGERKDFDQTTGDHDHPWSKGGRTQYDNLVILCKTCNTLKSNG